MVITLLPPYSYFKRQLKYTIEILKVGRPLVSKKTHIKHKLFDKKFNVYFLWLMFFKQIDKLSYCNRLLSGFLNKGTDFNICFY